MCLFVVAVHVDGDQEFDKPNVPHPVKTLSPETAVNSSHLPTGY